MKQKSGTLSASRSGGTVPTAEAAAVRLAPFAGEHLKATYDWLKDAELRSRIDCCGEPPSYEFHERYWRSRAEDARREDFAILDSGGRHIGNGGLHLDERREAAELWIYLGIRRGCGFGRGALEKLVEYGFRKMHLRRIFVRVLKSNPEGRKFFEAGGFRFEGVMEKTKRDGREYPASDLLALRVGDDGGKS